MKHTVYAALHPIMDEQCIRVSFLSGNRHFGVSFPAHIGLTNIVQRMEVLRSALEETQAVFGEPVVGHDVLTFSKVNQ